MEILFGTGIYMLISSAFMIIYVWVQNIRSRIHDMLKTGWMQIHLITQKILHIKYFLRKPIANYLLLSTGSRQYPSIEIVDEIDEFILTLTHSFLAYLWPSQIYNSF